MIKVKGVHADELELVRCVVLVYVPTDEAQLVVLKIDRKWGFEVIRVIVNPSCIHLCSISDLHSSRAHNLFEWRPFVFVESVHFERDVRTRPPRTADTHI